MKLLAVTKCEEESPYKPEIDNSRSKQGICPQLCPQDELNAHKLKQGLRISNFSATLVLSTLMLSGLLLQLVRFLKCVSIKLVSQIQHRIRE